MIVFIYYWIPCYFIYCWIAFCQGILHQCPYDLMFGLPLFKILCWNPNLHWGTIGRWDFGGVGRVRLGHVSRDFVMALVALKVGENPSLYFALFPHARTEKRPCKDVEKKKKSLSASQEEHAFTRHQIGWHFNFGLLSLQNYEKCICCLKHPVSRILLWRPDEVETYIHEGFGL